MRVNLKEKPFHLATIVNPWPPKNLPTDSLDTEKCDIANGTVKSGRLDDSNGTKGRRSNKKTLLKNRNSSKGFVFCGLKRFVIGTWY